MVDVTSPIHLNTLRARLTRERLASYDAVARGSDAEAIALYEWNTAASAAFFASLQGFEVVLRNALHRELTTWHTARRLPGEWYDDPQDLLDDRGQRDIYEARRRVSVRRRPITRGRVVSELSFGFWRYLLTSRYEQSLWTPALRHAFPELRPQRRREVADRVARLHLLRNRLAHHEPIHRRDLETDYADLLFVAATMCPHAAAWIERTSTVLAVISQRPGPRPPAPRRPPAERSARRTAS
ncbi:hypothetical protein [Actinoallomurus sp. CA-150999]|uniref:hypothetical protein n=1 Tax=Actinoallomurus sp. CA-150999 TaxID=3239887 RepID=UPI003D912B66